MSIADDPMLAEAFRHGRTQARLSLAVNSLRRIAAICRRGSLPSRGKLLEIDTDASVTLGILAEATGGVIDDMEPISK